MNRSENRLMLYFRKKTKEQEPTCDSSHENIEKFFLYILNTEKFHSNRLPQNCTSIMRSNWYLGAWRKGRSISLISLLCPTWDDFSGVNAEGLPEADRRHRVRLRCEVLTEAGDIASTRSIFWDHENRRCRITKTGKLPPSKQHFM